MGIAGFQGTKELAGISLGGLCGWKGAMDLTAESLAGSGPDLNSLLPQWEGFGGLQAEGT